MHTHVVTYKGSLYKFAGGVGKYTVYDSVSAWHFAQTNIKAKKVVALDTTKGPDVFQIYYGPTMKDITEFHLKGGGTRKAEDLKQILSESDIPTSMGKGKHVTAEKTRTCDVCGLEVPLSKWKNHQYYLAGVRTTLCKGMKKAKQEAYAKISARRIQSAKAQARAQGFRTDEEIEAFLRGLDFGVGTLGKKKSGEMNMKNAGYRGEKVPVAPKGPVISPNLTKSPFAPKENHVKVGPVTKSIPSVAVPGKKSK